MRRFPTPAQLAWVERAVGPGARVTGGRRMPGGITSSVHRLSLRLPGGAPAQVVLKRYVDPDWGGAREVENEAAALGAAERAGLPAPRPLGAAPDGAGTDGVPSLVMTRAPGRVWLDPDDLDGWVGQLAAMLATLHTAKPGTLLREPVVPRTREREERSVPASARRPELWIAAQRAIDGSPPAVDATFVHGDYQHFNVLWSRGRLSAVVDWASARRGPPDIDTGHCRLNLAVLHSAALADHFRSVYEAAAGRRVEPWWDIRELLDYDDRWQEFIPVQVAGRAAVDARGMTSRVEELLAAALARL